MVHLDPNHVRDLSLDESLSPRSPSVQKFFAERETLIAHEKTQRSDHKFRQSLSHTAVKAHSIVFRIRLAEHESIWSSSQAQDSKEELFPGMIFNSAKNHMESTSLYKIVKRMPKGAILHCHLGAMVDLRWLFGMAVKTSGMCISSSLPLIDENSRRKAVIKIEYFKHGKEGEGSSIWGDDYKPLTQVPLNEAAESYPDGGKEGFMSWMKDYCSITQSEALQHHLGIADIWKKLVAGFIMITPIVFYEPITRAFLREFFKTAAKDGVRWIEMRGMTRTFRLEGQDDIVKDRTSLPRIIDEEVRKFKKTEEGKKLWGVRMIWDCLRSFSTEQIIDDMKQSIHAKKLYPALLSGYDLVGPEDHGRTLHSLTPELLWFRKQCALEGVNIPFFFHAGECLGEGDSTDHNLFDAILFKTRRIGHGFSLYKHPHLIDLVKERQILVESCPISNEVLRYSASIMSHPLPALLARGIPVALSNDDPSMMGQEGAVLTPDFWQALQGWDNLGLAGLGSLAQNSVRWAAFEDQTDDEWLQDVAAGADGTGIRAQRIKEWNADWEEFCSWVVSEFGTDEEKHSGC